MILRPSQPYSQSNLIPILIANPFQPNANPANPLQFQQIIYLTEQTLPSTANHLSQSFFSVTLFCTSEVAKRLWVIACTLLGLKRHWVIACTSLGVKRHWVITCSFPFLYFVGHKTVVRVPLAVLPWYAKGH